MEGKEREPDMAYVSKRCVESRAEVGKGKRHGRIELAETIKLVLKISCGKSEAVQFDKGRGGRDRHTL